MLTIESYDVKLSILGMLFYKFSKDNETLIKKSIFFSNKFRINYQEQLHLKILVRSILFKSDRKEFTLDTHSCIILGHLATRDAIFIH